MSCRIKTPKKQAFASKKTLCSCYLGIVRLLLFLIFSHIFFNRINADRQLNTEPRLAKFRLLPDLLFDILTANSAPSHLPPLKNHISGPSTGKPRCLPVCVSVCFFIQSVEFLLQIAEYLE